jgi:hypothetical protein
MDDLTQFIIENQSFIWYFLAFFVFLYVARVFFKISKTIFNNKKVFKIR